MSLKNFGGVLDFAIELENEDASFLQQAGKNPELSGLGDDLEGLMRENQKNMKALTRARQENVTEMILEPIQGLKAEEYQMGVADPGQMKKTEFVDNIKQREERAERFYQDAAVRIKPVSDVARTFERLAKKRKVRKEKVESLT